MFNLLNDDLDYLDSEKDFSNRQLALSTGGNKRRQQHVRAVLDDESSLQEWIYDAYVSVGRAAPNIWDPKFMKHARTNI